MSKRSLAALAAPFLLLASLSFAQTATTTESPATEDAAAQPLTDTVTLPAWPTAGVTLADDSQPVAASFSLGNVEGIDAKLLSGVTANGYARKVEVEDQSIGQVLITTVAKDGNEEAISSEGLTAQFDASESSQLFPEKNVEVKGSKAALIAALERLANAKAETKDETATKTEDSAAMTTSGGTSNDLASDYKVPTSTATAATEEEDPTVSYMTTTEGCSVRVDLASGNAYEQNKVQTFTDGTLTSETQCSDSASYPLKQSYVACGDEVDLTELKAWPLYTLYYVDTSGENHTVSECTKDEETYYAITEDEGQCSISLDFQDGKAVPQSALVYTNRNNAVVQARGCQDSTLSSPYEMTKSTSGCTIRHDYVAGISYEQSMWTYTRDGVTYVASACADDGVTFNQETVYQDGAGEYICNVVTDLAAGTAILQSRKAITVDGTQQYITECTPDTSATTVYATTDGCMDFSTWTHDVSAGVSYGQERYYLTKADGSRHYVTACQTSGDSYIQDHELTGYQYHDNQLYAYPLMTVKITVNGNNYTIANSAVLDGAQQIPYTLNGTATQQTGDSIYEGCSGYYVTALYEKWERPDETTYLKPIGEGTAVGPRNICQNNLVATKNFLRTVYRVSGSDHWCDGDGDCFDSGWVEDYYTTWKGGHYQNVNFETGDVVTDYYAWISQVSADHIYGCISTPYCTLCEGRSGDYLPNVPEDF